MRSPGRKRPPPRQLADSGDRDLAALAERASYIGSPEHKRYPSAAGPPVLRSDATPCPADLASFSELTEWLREAIGKGQVGTPWEGDFPRYAWLSNGEGTFEARLTNRELGQYKGYPLLEREIPGWLQS